MKKFRYSTLLILALTVNLVFGQKASLSKEADNSPENKYIRTSSILLELANTGYHSPAILKKLGDSFYFNGQMKEACKWYVELVKHTSEVEEIYFFRYAQALQSIGNYEDADRWMIHYLASTDQNWSVKNYVSFSELNSSQHQQKVEKIKLFNLNINTEVSDFGSELIGDSLFFSSSREEGEIYAPNGQPYLDLYIASRENDSTFFAVKPIQGKINTRYHESSAALTPDHKSLYFTRNNFYRNRYRTAKDRVNKLKIFKASKNIDKNLWDKIEPLGFNSDEYSVAHPCFNPEGTKMYFASDMPGSFGHSDLYSVDVLPDGTLGTPTNLGPKINTEKQETFPFINSNGDLFFASNGLPGMGGLDIFVVRNFESQMTANDELRIDNPGTPINSSQDDFGYHEANEPNVGFFTSNRQGGKGDDDIYGFRIFPCYKTIDGLVKEKTKGNFVSGTTVKVFDQTGSQLLDSLETGESGRFSFELPCYSGYLIRAAHPHYIGDEAQLLVHDKTFEKDIELSLTPDNHRITEDMDLAEVLDISMIYFDLNKHNIRRDAAIELQKITQVMKQHPQIEIDVRSHTDCRGSAAYNLSLSEARAQSTHQYLIDQGIDQHRITATGLGESEPVNECDCDNEQQAPCSEEQHQMNRRSEFIITKLN
ncbi:OmpA family protein [Mangrovibacterium sp.]|uniref:OmpA family protein n=1 Tax=Mangrovibacterium sp. TaxID=1961364 RepID=UPI0035644872